MINERILEATDGEGLVDGDIVIINSPLGSFVINGLDNDWRSPVEIKTLNDEIVLNGTTYRVIAWSVLDRAYYNFGDLWLLERVA